MAAATWTCELCPTGAWMGEGGHGRVAWEAICGMPSRGEPRTSSNRGLVAACTSGSFKGPQGLLLTTPSRSRRTVLYCTVSLHVRRWWPTTFCEHFL